MDELPDLTSTPVSTKEHSFFNESKLLPSNLFGHYSERDSYNSLKLDTSNESSFTNGFFSPCRHSPRLLSNGYYVFDEDSFWCDDEGNISIDPTKSVVSYKENIVRIFRRRRRQMSQRSLNSSVNEVQEVGPFLLQEFWDMELDLSDTSSNLCPDQCAFVYDIKNWTQPMQCCESQERAPDKNPEQIVSGEQLPMCGTPITEKTCRDHWKNPESTIIKRWIHHVILLSAVAIFILTARFWPSERVSAVLTAILMISLFCLAVQPSRALLQPVGISNKVT